MMSNLIVSVLTMCSGADPIVPAIPGVAAMRIMGPEAPGDYKHPAAMTELDNGDLYLAYYGGSGEYGVDTKVFGARRRPGEEAFSTPEVIAETPFRSAGNPVVWQGPDGLVWLFYVVRYGETWSDSRIHAKISRDGAQTWSDSMLLAAELGMMVRNKPIVLRNGDYLLPIYHETGHDRENVGADTTSLFLRHNPKTREWTESSRIRSRQGNLQPAPAQITDDYLIAYCRRGGGYKPVTDGWLVRSESRDGGYTWSEGVDSEFPNPNSAVDLVHLRNGHLMLIYNNSMNRRCPLSVAISMDGGETWPVKKDIFTGPGVYAYPYAFQGKDDKIYLIFTSGSRTVINLAVFDEEAILKE